MDHEGATRTERPDSVNVPPRELPLREWLELGQALNNRSVLGPRYFREGQTLRISIGRGISVVADGKEYGRGDYVLHRRNAWPLL